MKNHHFKKIKNQFNVIFKKQQERKKNELIFLIYI